MKTVTGDIEKVFAAFGHAEADDEVVALFSQYEGAMKRSSFSGGRVYIGFPRSGVQFIRQWAKLSTMFLFLRAEDKTLPYQRTTTFIDGLDIATVKRDEIQTVLGKPYVVNPYDEKYRLNGHVLHVFYDDEDWTIWELNVLDTDIGER